MSFKNNRNPSALGNFKLIWKDLKFVAHPGTENEKVIINNVSGYLESNQLMAFLGPSGAGKSTVLESIIGKRKTGASGLINIRTNNVNEKINVAFIPQKDHLLNLLTVRESILIATKIQISKKIYEKQLLDPVISRKTNKKYYPQESKYCSVLCDNIIKDLALEVCEYNRIKSCSGGQMKRISIAQELASRPRIIFLDEPTSGLDSNSSYNLIKLLNSLTKSESKIAIMISIHQPSVKLFNAFDLVYVLSKKGNCIYQGKPTDVVPYLRRFDLNCPDFYNAADYIIEVANLDYGVEHIPKLAAQHLENFEKEFNKVDDKVHVVNLLDLFEKNRFPEFTHSYQLMIRSLLITLRDPLVFGLRFSSHIFMAYFFAVFFGTDVGIRGGCSPEIGEFDPSKLGNITDEITNEVKAAYKNIGSFFYLITFTAFSAVLPICIAFPIEMEVFTREYNNAWYTMKSYFLGKTLSEVPFQLVMPTMFAIFYYNLSNQPLTYFRMGHFVGITVISTFVAQSFGYFVGALFMHNVSAALFFGPLSLFPMMVSSGFFIKMKNVPEIYRPITYLSFMKYATEGLTISAYGFNRCGNASDKLLRENKEAFKVWLGAALGVFGSDGSIAQPDANDTDVENRPNEKFLDDVVNTTTDPFISTLSQKTQSLAMNEFDLEDHVIYINWVCLIIYLLVARIIVYYVIRFKAMRYAS